MSGDQHGATGQSRWTEAENMKQFECKGGQLGRESDGDTSTAHSILCPGQEA